MLLWTRRLFAQIPLYISFEKVFDQALTTNIYFEDATQAVENPNVADGIVDKALENKKNRH